MNWCQHYVYRTILVITKTYIILLLSFTSILLFIMRSQSASIAGTVTSTASFCYCWSYMDHSVLWIECVIIYLISANFFLVRYTSLFDFWFDKRQLYVKCIRQNWNICLTVILLWICWRFRYMEIKFFREMGTCIEKYTA